MRLNCTYVYHTRKPLVLLFSVVYSASTPSDDGEDDRRNDDDDDECDVAGRFHSYYGIVMHVFMNYTAFCIPSELPTVFAIYIVDFRVNVIVYSNCTSCYCITTLSIKTFRLKFPED